VRIKFVKWPGHIVINVLLSPKIVHRVMFRDDASLFLVRGETCAKVLRMDASDVWLWMINDVKMD